MEHRALPARRIPDRLPPRWARAQAALAVVVLLIGVAGVATETGWHRVAYGVAFGAMGAANLGWALASLVPDGRLSRTLLGLVPPLSVVMMVALGATLGFQFGWWG